MVSRPPAPGDLELVRQFVNTLDVEEGTDALSSPEALRDWYTSRGLTDGRQPVTAGDLAAARNVRDALRILLLANHGHPIDEQALATLNSNLAAHPLVLQLEPAALGVSKAPAPNVAQALARLLAIAFRAMAEGTWQRLKICKNDTCAWAFYDSSRNRSGNWCSMAVCGNRMKVRAYQERAKQRRARD